MDGQEGSETEGPVEWRRLTPALWGADGDGFVGCIEGRRRYLPTDGEGRAFARCQHLEEAEAVLAAQRHRGRAAARRDAA